MKRKKLTQIIVFILLTFILLNSCKDHKLVATVGNFSIYSDEYKKSYFVDKSPKQISKIPFDDKLNHLEQMIEDKLKLVDAYQSNVQNDSDLVAQLKLAERQQVYIWMINYYVIDKILTKNLLLERYSLQGQEVKVRHIFLPIGKNNSEELKNSKKEMLESVREKIMNGESFDSLARTFSKDSLSAGKGGELGFISWNDNKFGTDFFKAVCGLKEGELSGVIESKKGFHIVESLIKREKSQPAFEYEKETIQRSLFRENRQELDQTYKEFLEILKSRYAFTFNDTNLEYCVNLLYPQKNDSSKSITMLTIPELTSEDKELELAAFGEKYSIGDLVQEIQKIAPYRRPVLNTVEKMKNYINNMTARRIIIQYGYDKGVPKNKSIKKAMLEIEHQQMVKEIDRIKVFEKSTPSDEECKVYYEKNMNKFVFPSSAQVQEIMLTDSQKAQQVLAQLRNGKPFDELAKIYNERTTTKNKNGMLGYITSRQYGRIGKKANSMKKGEVSEIIKMGSNYSIIKILDKKPEAQKSFEESLASIKKELRSQNNKAAREAWIAELREKIPVKIYMSNFKSIFEESE